MSHVGIIGAGWAGLAAAVNAVTQGHQVSLWEASRQVGGRARSLNAASGRGPAYDNGQHLLMSAYHETRRVMETVGVRLDQVTLETHLDLRWPDGQGLALPRLSRRWPGPAQLAWALARARGWTWRDRWSLARWSLRWQRKPAPEGACVSDICAGLSDTALTQLIVPLCVSALNLPPEQASAPLFLAVLRDTLWQEPSQWRAWIPRMPLGQLFAEPALEWLRNQGTQVFLGERVQQLQLTPDGLRVQAAVDVDQLVLATPAYAAAPLARQLPHQEAQAWANRAEALAHTAIATAYAYAPGLRLPRPMMALKTTHAWDAQFVFDLGQLGHAPGYMAAVLSNAPSHSDGLHDHLAQQLRQALGDPTLEVKQLVLEKRATFAATPNAKRPSASVCPKVWACGDHVDGPYPATLEGAVRSARALPWSEWSSR